MTAPPGRAVSPGPTFDLPLRVSARADYAVRALTEIAASGGGPITGQRISRAQHIPLRFLLNILAELRRAGLLRSHRGSAAGYELTRPAERITLEEIIRIAEGNLASMHDTELGETSYPGPARALREVWLAVHSSLRTVLASVTLADVAAGTLPQTVRVLAAQPPQRQGSTPA